MSCARKLRSLSCLLGLVALAWLAGRATRRSLSRTTCDPILIAVPHRGSQIADNWIGNLGQSLYRADTDVQEAFRTLVEKHRDQINPFIIKLVREGKLSSIRTLSANSPALMALAEIPSAVPFHNIIGQVNSGPATSGNDGVVAYSSSRLDGAESELIVRYGHETFLHPDAVAEVKRILHAHLESL